MENNKKDQKILKSITNSRDMNLSKLWQIVKDKVAWRAPVCGQKESDMIQQLNDNKPTQENNRDQVQKHNYNYSCKQWAEYMRFQHNMIKKS